MSFTITGRDIVAFVVGGTFFGVIVAAATDALGALAAVS